MYNYSGYCIYIYIYTYIHIYIYIYDISNIGTLYKREKCGPITGSVGMVYCKGRDKGCTQAEGEVFGSNPYTANSSLCKAALHSNAISSQGGVYRVQQIGTLPNFTGAESNGIISSDYPLCDAITIHKSEKSEG